MTKPLKVVVTRPLRQAHHLCTKLEAAGAQAIAAPVIEILPARAPDQVAAHIGAVTDYDLLIFVSTNAVAYGRDYLPVQGLKKATIAAVGPSTARALAEIGLECHILSAAGFSSEALLGEPALNDVAGKRVLIVRGDGGRALLGDTLGERGAEVTYAEVYRREVPATSRAIICALLDAGDVDVITATSVETLCNIEDLAGPQRAATLHGVKLLTASARVVKKAAQMGFNRDVLLARAPDDQSLVDAVRAWQTQRITPAPGPEYQGMATEQDRPNEQPNPTDTSPPELAPGLDVTPNDEAAAHDAADDVETNTLTPPDDSAQSPAVGKIKTGRALSALALLVALGAVALSLFTFWQTRQSDDAIDPVAAAQALVADLRSDVQRQIGDLQTDVGNRMGRIDLGSVDELADSQTQLERNLRGQERSLATITDRLSGFENDMSALRGVSASVRNTWVRAEAEYFLQTANSRLQLAKDVNSALQALRAADERIGALGDPGLIPVRAKLTEEILAVEAVPQPDVEGIALALNGLAERVDELPLAQTLTSRLTRDDEQLDDTQGWERAKKSIAGLFSQIVRVTPSDGNLTELMAPEQAFFLYRNLQINLQIARLALMKGDTENFRASVRAAREWLTTHYDTDDTGVASTLTRLDEMLQVDIDPAVPDISGSLRLLRAIVAASGASQ